jgi:signal transduction histidine kinase/ActR/RegA family two-component response regulator
MLSYLSRIIDPTIAILAASVVLCVLLVVYLYRRGVNERGRRTESERALAQATSLVDLSAALSRATTPDEVARAAVTELLHVFGATAGAVVIRPETDADAQVVHAAGYDASLVSAGQRIPANARTPLNDAMQRHELIVIESPSARAIDFPHLSPWDFLARYDAAAVIPLFTGNRILGVLALSIQRPRTFTGEERTFLLTAGRHTAQSLVRATAFDVADHARAEGEEFRVRAAAELRERQRAEQALRESEGKYRALATRTARLYELSAALSEAITLDAVAKVIIRHGKAVVGASAGSVAVLVNDGREFETLYAEDYTRQVVEAWHRFPADVGLCSTAAVETRAPVYVGSLGEWQQLYPRSAAPAADGGFASAAALPLLSEGAVFGVVSFHFTAPINFNEEYDALLRSVAQHCGQALDRARLYEAAQRARADAESANRAKDDFLSTVSHELRTPLNAMLGWASMLREGTLDASRRARALESIFSSATRQARLIEDLLDVSRIVAGRASLDPQEFGLAESLRGAVDAIMPQAENKGLELHLDCVPDATIVADPRRLEQVFLNLLANAVKFTPAGGRITVGAAIVGEAVDIRVTDTGSGIDSAFLPHVFERFRQADGSVARRVGGLGLGLFIARHLVEAHGGTIGVESPGVDCGTTFTVRLPMASSTSMKPGKATRNSVGGGESVDGPSLEGVRVLIVDDEPDAREVMASALETRGAKVTPVPSARDALDTLAGSDFDVLLADIAMPGEDGYQLIRRIRRLPAARFSAIPAVAVTACASEEDRREALDAGFQIHLTKPVAPDVLVRTVADLARQPQST